MTTVPSPRRASRAAPPRGVGDAAQMEPEHAPPALVVDLGDRHHLVDAGRGRRAPTPGRAPRPPASAAARMAARSVTSSSSDRSAADGRRSMPGDAPAALGQPAADARPDAARRPGDQGDLAVLAAHARRIVPQRRRRPATLPPCPRAARRRSARSARSTRSRCRASPGCGPSPACPALRTSAGPTWPCWGAPFDGATTFRAGARFGPAGDPRSVAVAQALQRGAGHRARSPPSRSRMPATRRRARWTSRPATRPSSRRPARSRTTAGACSASAAITRSASRCCGPPPRPTAALSLLQLDAHTDTWDSYFGARYTHGTIFRRAAEEGLIDAGASVQIGLRGSLYGAGGSRREPCPRLHHAARARLRGRGAWRAPSS